MPNILDIFDNLGDGFFGDLGGIIDLVLTGVNALFNLVSGLF